MTNSPEHVFLSVDRSYRESKVLFMPAMPTPNGRLHLGHIAGPFLKMDILNRHRKSRGANALLVTGVDAYESHVTLAAFREGSCAEDIVNKYSELIEKDLNSVGISCDAFINPLSQQYREEFVRWNLKAFDRLRESGCVVEKLERVPIGKTSGRYITGCWVAGYCPECRSMASGYCCSNCGYHFSAEELIDAKPRVEMEDIRWSEVECLYLRIDDPEGLVKTRPEKEGVRQKVLHYLDRHEGLVRVTAPSEWGIPAPKKSLCDIPQVIFTYTAIGYQLMAANSFRVLRGDPCNAFDRDSDITVVGSFGSDNIIPFSVGMQGSLLAAGFKPFDHFLINEMMTLQGKHFSTSNNYAVWVHEVIDEWKVHPDMVRYCLAEINPEDGVTDLSLEALRKSFDSIADRWAFVPGIYDIAVMSAADLNAPPDELIVKLTDLLVKQNEILDLDNKVTIRDLPPLIDEWLDFVIPNEPSECYWWIKGLALLSYPLLPIWSHSVWSSLGQSGYPCVAAFFEIGKPVRKPISAFAKVSPAWQSRSQAFADVQEVETA